MKKNNNEVVADPPKAGERHAIPQGNRGRTIGGQPVWPQGEKAGYKRKLGFPFRPLTEYLRFFRADNALTGSYKRPYNVDVV